MKKIIIFLFVIIFVAKEKILAQELNSPGIYTAFQLKTGKIDSFTWAPQAWFYSGNNFYFEGRFNYEETNTGSFYFGYARQVQGTKDDGISVTPMLGPVLGQLNGFSIAGDLDITKPLIELESENEYVSGHNKGYEYYLFDWSKASFSFPSENIRLGAEGQFQCGDKKNVDLSPLLRIKIHDCFIVEANPYYDFLNRVWIWNVAIAIESD